MNRPLWTQTIAPTLSLFTSVGTLVCCALPALLVTLGMGAVLAGIVSDMPWLVALSEYKSFTFAIAGIMLALAGYMQWKGRHAPCPIDPKKAKACTRLRKISLGIYILSIVLFVIGAFFTFIAVHIFY